jgi:hypothetical protein
MGFTRIIAVIVLLIGVVSLALGVMFVIQGNDGKKDLIDDLNPILLDQVNAKYDAVRPLQIQAMAAEEPKIQAKQAAPSATYNYYSAQRALLGLAKSNQLVAQFVMTSGYVTMAMGIGLLLVGVTLFSKAKA